MAMNASRFQAPMISNFPVRRVLSPSPSPAKCYFRRQTSPRDPLKITLQNQTLPARDRVIDFGKYKGRMLGTLPSTYLKWVSKNLRARDFEEWANLADQVLKDPIYKDRIEWEFAENVLNGNRPTAANLSSSSPSSVAELMDISERFGWDNDDKEGWATIEFELLGTSRGGRIPRIEKRTEGVGDSRAGAAARGLELGDGGRRKERRERQKQKMRKEAEIETETETRVNSGIVEMRRGRFVNETRGNGEALTLSSYYESEKNEIGSPFPGREALLRKVLNRRRVP